MDRFMGKQRARPSRTRLSPSRQIHR